MAIDVKPSHEGLLHRDLGVRQGRKLTVSEEEAAKRSDNPAERKRATFALNARKFNHGGGRKKAKPGPSRPKSEARSIMDRMLSGGGGR
jgi:hypothetical protein